MPWFFYAAFVSMVKKDYVVQDQWTGQVGCTITAAWVSMDFYACLRLLILHCDVIMGYK